MKTLTTLSFLLITSLVLAQNWNLFPPYQGTYYKGKPKATIEYEDILYFSADSFRTELQGDIWYVNSKYLPDSLLNCRKPKHLNSFSLRNDTLFYHKNFYILPKAKLGESWYMPFRRYIDSVKITYEKIEQIEFLGITDSVKTYSYEAIGIHADSTNLDEQVMRLSKHFGFIEYVPLQRFTKQWPSPKLMGAYTIFGIENDTLQIGYQPKKLEEFLPNYNTGDILFWREMYIGEFVLDTLYFKDSITQLIQNNDSLYYLYNRTTFNWKNEVVMKQDSLAQSLVYADYEHIVTAKPGLAGYGLGNSLHIPKNKNLLYVWDYIRHLKDLEGYTRVGAFTLDIIDLDSCFTYNPDKNYSFVLSSGRGLTSIGRGDSFSSFSANLIGTKINGVEEGILEVPEPKEVVVAEEDTMGVIMNPEEMEEDSLEVVPVATGDLLSQSTLSLYPNPANHFLSIHYNNEKLQNPNYQIVDINGRLVLEDKLQSDFINVYTLKPGIYFFKLQLENNYLTIKFVKA